MSVYTIRVYEGKFKDIAGKVYAKSDLPEDAKVGDIYKIWGDKDTPEGFYKKNIINDEVVWERVEYVPEVWKLLKVFVPGEKPAKAYYINEYGAKCYYEDDFYDSAYYTFEENENNKTNDTKFCLINDWANNGGPIRDDYVSCSWSDGEISGRGIPNDISAETKEAISDKDGDLRGYDRTYVTLNDWMSLYNSEEKRILSKLKDLYQKKAMSRIEEKIDFFIQNMKSPIDADVHGFYEKMNKKKSDEDLSETEDYYYDDTSFDIDDEIQFMLEEEMPKLYFIASEIGRMKMYADFYNIYGDDDIRAIMYLEH